LVNGSRIAARLVGLNYHFHSAHGDAVLPMAMLSVAAMQRIETRSAHATL
jgi:hypothetical protein